MPKKKKRFIDKKNAVTYQLIHRSQKDPLQADENAPQHVLVATDELSQIKRKENLATYGIYFDDDYDYEQHLRNVDDLNAVGPSIDLEQFRVGATAKSKFDLPSEVLPSTNEEEIGMLELAAPISGPKLDWDPDIVAALDSDNEDAIDGELEDDFMELANQEFDGNDESYDPGDMNDRQRQWLAEQMIQSDAVHTMDLRSADGVQQQEEQLSSDFEDEDFSDDDVGSLPSFSDEETKTRFTNYSMSSSVIRRNQGLTLVDDRFEQLYAEYDDDEIGALDDQEIDGKVRIDGPMMEHLLSEFEKQKLKTVDETPDKDDSIEVCSEATTSDEEDEEMCKVVVEEGQKWDCESILSTYSNLYNHPKKIEEPWKQKSSKIKLTKKLGIPLESLPQKGLTKKQLQTLDQENDMVKVSPVRPKSESAEEKKARKAAVKQERKERRIEKKNTKLAFKEEAASQKRNQMNSKINLQGNKIL